MSLSRTVWMIGWGVLLFAGCAPVRRSARAMISAVLRWFAEKSACVTPCASDSVCGEQAICNDSLCETGCRSDVQCPLGQSCSSGQCANGCASSDRYEAYQYFVPQTGSVSMGAAEMVTAALGKFCEDNKCVPIGGGFDAGVACAEHDDCRVGEFNPEGRCAVGCRLSTCPRNRRCDEATGVVRWRRNAAARRRSVSPDTLALRPMRALRWDSTSAVLSVRRTQSTRCRSVRTPNCPSRSCPSSTRRSSGRWCAHRATRRGALGGSAGSASADRAAARRVLRLAWCGHLRGGDRALRCRGGRRGAAARLLGRVELGRGSRPRPTSRPGAEPEPCERDVQCPESTATATIRENASCTGRSFSSRDGRDGDCWARNANPMWGDPNNSSTPTRTIWVMLAMRRAPRTSHWKRSRLAGSTEWLYGRG